MNAVNLPRHRAAGTGPTVLMLHGIGGGADAFAPQLAGLSQLGLRAVAWDAPGYGSSEIVMPYTFEALADSAILLIEDLITQSGELALTLLGHSMGGMVAQEVAARRPDLVKRLILAGTSSAFGKLDGAWQAAFYAERTAPLDAGASMAELAQSLIPTMLGPQADENARPAAQAVMARVPQATYRLALQCLMGFDRRESLRTLPMPVLLIAGEFDRNSAPHMMQRMGHAVAAGSFTVMSGIGHLMPLEAPTAFNQLVVDFIRTDAKPPQRRCNS